MSTRTEVLVVGGGLAGAAAALMLARAGHPAVLVEREREARHKVCGEFLSAEALAMLRLLGVDAAALGALPVRGVRLCGTGAREAVAQALPFPALSLSRRCLDRALLAAAEQAGVEVQHGASVVSLVRCGSRWCARLDGGETLEAERVVLATGKHDLRGWARPPGKQNDLVALKMYFLLDREEAAALGDHVELLLHPGGYTGLQRVGEGANLCCLVRRTQLMGLGGWAGLLAELRAANAHARQRLRGAEPMLAKPLAVASLPYGFVRRRAVAERVWAVGDQAAVIPSFTGDGMSLALLGGLRAAQSIRRGETAESFQAALGRDVHRQVARATAVSRILVNGPGQTVLTGAVRVFPGLLGAAAALTRIRMQAMVDIGVADFASGQGLGGVDSWA